MDARIITITAHDMLQIVLIVAGLAVCWGFITGFSIGYMMGHPRKDQNHDNEN